MLKGSARWEPIALALSGPPSIMKTDNNDIILCVADDVRVFEGDILAVVNIRTCDLAAVEAVAAALADGVLRLAQSRGLLE